MLPNHSISLCFRIGREWRRTVHATHELNSMYGKGTKHRVREDDIPTDPRHHSADASCEDAALEKSRRQAVWDTEP